MATRQGTPIRASATTRTRRSSVRWIVTIPWSRLSFWWPWFLTHGSTTAGHYQSSAAALCHSRKRSFDATRSRLTVFLNVIWKQCGQPRFLRSYFFRSQEPDCRHFMTTRRPVRSTGKSGPIDILGSVSRSPTETERTG